MMSHTSVVDANVHNVNSEDKETDNTNLIPPNFLVGIMHVTKDPWLSITNNGQIPSWEKNKFKSFKVIYFSGISNSITIRINSIIENLRWVRGRYASYGISYFLMFLLKPWKGSLPKSKLVDERISKVSKSSLRVRIPEMTATMRWKKLSFLAYFLEMTAAEYVVITTSSSLLNFDPIVEFVNNSIDTNKPIYAGRILRGYDCEFTSGSFTLMNRESARLLLENRRLIPVHVMDDIGFGTAFKQLGVTPIEIKSIDFDSVEKIKATPPEVLSSIGHYRFKSGSHNSRGDVILMQELMLKLDK